MKPLALATIFVFYQAAGPFKQSLNLCLVSFEPPLQAHELFCHAGKFGHSLHGCQYLLSKGPNILKAWSAPPDLRTLTSKPHQRVYDGYLRAISSSVGLSSFADGVNT
jgi:hypothetical protein